MRMLDNVIDYNYYSVPKARRSNLRHRPVGLGIMGFQDALYKLRLPYSSEEAVNFADKSMETVSYYVIKASTNLAEERGPYSTYNGSLWSQGILPIDSMQHLSDERGDYLQANFEQSLNWEFMTVISHVLSHVNIQRCPVILVGIQEKIPGPGIFKWR